MQGLIQCREFQNHSHEVLALTSIFPMNEISIAKIISLMIYDSSLLLPWPRSSDRGEYMVVSATALHCEGHLRLEEDSVSERVAECFPSGLASMIARCSSSEMVLSIPVDVETHPPINLRDEYTLHRGYSVWWVRCSLKLQ